MKSVYLMLTRTESIASKLVRVFTGSKYTHASIAFDEELYHLYSSGRKKGLKMFPAGPCMEGLDKGFFGRDPHTPCIVFEIPVENEVYEKARAEVEGFMINNEQYKFSILGTFACKLGIEWKRKNKYFCSQFVAEILNRSGAAKLPKAASLMRPMDCAELEGMNLIFEGNIGQLKETIRNKEKEPATV